MFQNMSSKCFFLFFFNSYFRGKIKEEKQQEVESVLFYFMDISRPWIMTIASDKDNSPCQGESKERIRPSAAGGRGRRWDGMPVAKLADCH